MSRRAWLLVVVAGVAGAGLGALSHWFVTTSSLFAGSQKSSRFYSEFKPEILTGDAVPEKCRWTELGKDMIVDDPSQTRGTARMRRFTAIWQDMNVSPGQFVESLMKLGLVGNTLMDANVTGGMRDGSSRPVCFCLRYRAGKFGGTVVITGTNPDEKANPGWPTGFPGQRMRLVVTIVEERLP
jgi:hypothetical protein